jgi:hypothetical protein
MRCRICKNLFAAHDLHREALSARGKAAPRLSPGQRETAELLPRFGHPRRLRMSK